METNNAFLCVMPATESIHVYSFEILKQVQNDRNGKKGKEMLKQVQDDTDWDPETILKRVQGRVRDDTKNSNMQYSEKGGDGKGGKGTY